MSEYLERFIGNVYRNYVTGNEWKIVRVKDRTITLKDSEGNEFDTCPEAMGNYEWIRWEEPSNKEGVSHEDNPS